MAEREPARQTTDESNMASPEITDSNVLRNVSLISWQNMENLSESQARNSSGQPRDKAQRCSSDGRVISCLYGIVLATLGVALPLEKALATKWLDGYVEAIFLVYLYAVAVMIFIVMEVYLHRRRRLESRRLDTTPFPQSTPKRGFDNVSYVPEPPPGGADVGEGDVNAAGCFDRVRAGQNLRYESTEEVGTYSSLYLRIGAGIFGLAATVHTGLLVKQAEEDKAPTTCHRVHMYWTRYAQIAFLLSQTYFVFKHSKIHLTRAKPIARLAFMHVIAVNWCIWVRSIMRETLDDWLRRDWAANQHADVSANETCYDDDILHKATPYLFPFVVEYSMVVIVAVYILYAGLDSSSQSDARSPHNVARVGALNTLPPSLHGTHRGMFVGIVVVAGSVVSVILFFSYLEDPAHAQTPGLIFLTSAVALCGLSAIAVVLAWRQTCELHSDRRSSVSGSDAMLMLSATGLLLFNVLRIIVVVREIRDGARDANTILAACDCLCSMVLAVLQTTFIIGARTRRTVTLSQERSKPGRGSVMFLLCANFALWLLRSLQIKQLDGETSSLADAYGELPRHLIVLVLVPFVIYYHFHSSASLGDIWSHAYREQPMARVLAGVNGAAAYESPPLPRAAGVAGPYAPPTGPLGPNVSAQKPAAKLHGKVFTLDVDALNSPVSDV